MSTKGGRVALVTGGTRGLGRLISEGLAADGHHVAAVYASDAAAAAELEAAAAGSGASIRTVRAELSDPVACQRIAEQVAGWHGRIDYLINNAAIMRDGTMLSLPPDDWDAVINVDLSAVFYMTRAVMPMMVDAGFGRIVMLGSSAGVTGSPARPAYSAAKAGLLGLTRSIAQGYSKKGITANVLVVGPTVVGIGAGADERSMAALVDRMPTGRPVPAGEIVHAVRFLVDDLAGAVTGSTVTVDGGMTM